MADPAELHLLRYEREGAPEDLEVVIAGVDGADDLAGLANQAIAFAYRFELSRDERDLDAAADGFRRAIELAEPGSEQWAHLKSNLGGALMTRFKGRRGAGRARRVDRLA